VSAADHAQLQGAERPSGSGKVAHPATGSIGGVEIVGFPQLLYTRTSGDPDTLFVPLLDAAREACGMIERLAGHGENHSNAAQLSGMHLVSSLLRDSSFSLVSRGLSHDNSYRVDLEGGTLHAHTRLYAAVSRRAAFFKVEIAVKIAGGPLVVRNPIQGTVLMQADDSRFRQPGFFSSTLSTECLRALMQQERFGEGGGANGAATEGSALNEIRLNVQVSGLQVPVVLQRKTDDGKWEILDGRYNEWVGTLAPAAEAQLSEVMKHLQELFATK